MSRVIETRELSRWFGARVALRSVELELDCGRILGLAGPNGSGKTTLLKILGGLLRPTRGTARVFGLEPFRSRTELMCRARFAFAPPPLYERLTARDHLRYLGALGAAEAPSDRDMTAALELVGLTGRDREAVRSFSFGMRQRLGLAQALVPLPELLVLDEPADGLDPLAVLELRAILGRLRDESGITIVLSSHLLLELDQLVDELLVLDEGETLFYGPPSELRSDGTLTSIVVDDADGAIAALGASGIRPIEVTPHRQTLEQALLDRLRSRRTGAAR